MSFLTLVKKSKILLGSSFIFALTVLTGCGSMGSKDTEYISYESPSGEALVCKVPFIVDHPAPIVWQDVNFKVIGNAEVKQLNEATQNGTDVSIIALESEDFENLSINLSNLQRYINVQKLIIDSLQEYYSLPESAEDENQ